MVLYTGNTVEEAIEKGLKELDLPRLKAHIKVISKEKKGFLGFGKKLAQVDIEGINEKTVYKADKKATQGVPEEINRQNAPVVKPESSKAKAENVQVSAEAVEQKEEVSAEVVEAKTSEQSFEEFVATEFSNQTSSQEIEKATEEVLAYVTKIIYEMDIEASIEPSHNRRQINLQIETQEPGRVIGYHGKVLKSLQLLAQNFLHDRYSKNFSISINVHDYVEHRTETLIDFTQKIAARVLETEENYTMDPMSNSERKIVHKTVSMIEGVTSFSEGNDPNRYVVVSLEN
ncbi:RNA-binding cell elongation regulator Jag/EloR [Streptococcus iniae]|uniref:RNA-binding protein KhpB n=2 Tax=Streptococcus iniae TaxID=1346 RepID=A0A3L8GD95_STRIN|nr:RNA-binding cell elongation regulator Jag/EloR [Streptococcus iniae]AGM99702.1 ssDNA-binding protein [Streptococcus iniae SF1]AHY16613.1 Jag protein [Streptococcus iniae]AHY18479.1 Jag protein [Streptococcus iniae]AJG26744.1 Jag protein [Streptococcus iniae]APD32639.1 protein jag [Streptococcus iniae]